MIRLIRPTDSIFPPLEEFSWSNARAGFLARGLSYSPRLPVPFTWNSGMSCGFRPHSQRRVRDGFQPSSLHPDMCLCDRLYNRGRYFCQLLFWSSLCDGPGGASMVILIERRVGFGWFSYPVFLEQRHLIWLFYQVEGRGRQPY